MDQQAEAWFVWWSTSHRGKFGDIVWGMLKGSTKRSANLVSDGSHRRLSSLVMVWHYQSCAYKINLAAYIKTGLENEGTGGGEKVAVISKFREVTNGLMRYGRWQIQGPGRGSIIWQSLKQLWLKRKSINGWSDAHSAMINKWLVIMIIMTVRIQFG